MMSQPSPWLTFLHALICLTAVVHPVGYALASLPDTPRDAAARWRLTLRACVLGGAALVALAGAAGFVCELLGLGLPPVRLGCAALLGLAAAELTTHRPPPRAAAATGQSVTGQALALIEVPGTSAAAVLVAVRTGAEPVRMLAALAAWAMVLGFVLLAVRHARYLMRRLGLSGAVAIGRAMAVPLAVLAAQELLSALRDVIVAP